MPLLQSHHLSDSFDHWGATGKERRFARSAELLDACYLATMLSADVVVVELKYSSRVLWVVHTWGVENNNIIIKRAANYLIAAETT